MESLIEYYDKVSENYKKIIDCLKDLEVQISSKDLSDLTGIHHKSIGRYLKRLVDDNIIDSVQFSPEYDTRVYKLFSLKGNVKIKDVKGNFDKKNEGLNDQENIIEVKQERKQEKKQERKQVNENIDVEKLKYQLKQEILKEFMTNERKEAKRLLIKVINTLPIREVDKRDLKLSGKASAIRNRLVDLIDLITIV